MGAQVRKGRLSPRSYLHLSLSIEKGATFVATLPDARIFRVSPAQLL